MAQTGKLVAQTEIKSSAAKTYGFYKNNMNRLVQIFPQNFKSFEIVGGGDEIKTGSITSSKFDLGTPMTMKTKVEALDEENKSISFAVIEGDILKLYNSFKTKLEAIEKANGGGLVKWTIEFEKADDNAPTPDSYVDFAIQMSKGIDAYLYNN